MSCVLHRLQPLDSHRARCTHVTGLPGQARLAGLATIGAIHHTALGLAACTCASGLARFTTGTAVNPHTDLLGRVVARQFNPHLPARSTGLSVATIVAIGSGARRAPGAAWLFAIAAIKPGKPRRARTATRIDGQLRRLQ